MISKRALLFSFCAACGAKRAPAGTVAGTVTTATGGVLAGVTVTITPSKGAAAALAVTGQSGTFSFANVPVSPGTGSLSVSTLPGPCTAPAPVPYKSVSSKAALAVPLVVSCDRATDPAGLWLGGTMSYGASALASSGAPPLTDLCPPSFATAGAEAFDGNGNLWTQFPGGTATALAQWSAAQLATACSASAQPAITISDAGTDFYALAFDAQGTLWASTGKAALIYGFAAAQLTTTQTATPSFVIAPDEGSPAALRDPHGLAVDAAGSLWVANGGSLLAYKATTLAAATNANVGPVPDAVITTPENQANLNALAASPTVYPNAIFTQLAFDSLGNLWVTGLRQDTATSATSVIWRYAAADLAGAATAHLPAPALVLERSADQTTTKTAFGALAFDATGNLWVGAYSTGPNLLRYPASALASGGAPDIELRAPVASVGASLAFTPAPAGLPIRAPK